MREHVDRVARMSDAMAESPLKKRLVFLLNTFLIFFFFRIKIAADID